MKRLGAPLLALSCLASGAAGAEDPRPEERGYPVLETYGPGDYSGGTQNFDLAQDPSGLLYVANLHGLLVHDGAWWQRVSLANFLAVFCVEADAQGRIAAGGVDEMGILKGDGNGALAYESLLPLLPEAERSIGDVWRIHATSRGFVYDTDVGLFRWDGQALTTVLKYADPEARKKTHLVEDRLFVWVPDQGLHTLEADGLRIVPGDPLRERSIDVMLPFDGDRLLLAIDGQGLALWDGRAIIPTAPRASARLKEHSAREGVRLPDGRYALATRGGGVLLLRSDGELERVIDQQSGLPDASVHALTVDRDGSLWVATDDGLARIETAVPLTVFDGRSGLGGSVVDVARHRGRLWVGSWAGLFWLDQSDGQARLQRASDVPADMSEPHDVGDELLVGTGQGLYRGGESGFRLVPGTRDLVVYGLQRSTRDPARVWLGTRNGLTSVRREGDRWRLESEVEGAPRYVNTLVEKGDTLWIGSVVGGVARVSIDERRTLSKGEGEFDVYAVGDRILVTDGEQVLLLDETTGKPRPDPRLAALAGHGMVFRLAEASDGALWLNTVPPHVALPAASGAYDTPAPLATLAADDIQGVAVESDGVVWFMANNGLFRYAGDPRDLHSVAHPPLVRRVTRGGSEVLFGGVPDAAERVPALPYRHGRLRIEFAPASYRPGVQYQYRLDPAEPEWSAWSDAAFTEYTQLGEGGYSFRVRSRPAGGDPSADAAWDFRVGAPWYRTYAAWFGWLGGAVLFVGGYTRVRTAGLRRRASELEATVAQRTQELRQAVDDLTHAQADVEEKNQLLEAANTRLDELSRHDDLTGLWNRRHLDAVLKQEWNRARRHGQRLSFIMMDLDHFKRLNDERGHAAGDTCLRAVSVYLEEQIGRSGDVVARYGGEEFALLLPGSDVETARQLAERLREGIEALAIPRGDDASDHLTASFGVASVVPGQADGPEMLLEVADQALYRAKSEGRNLVRLSPSA